MTFTAEQIRKFTDHYFVNAQAAARKVGNNRRVLYQVFQRQHAVLCGMRHVTEFLRQTSPAVQVFGLADGDTITPLEPVLHIVGPAQELFVLETIYLGLLARMTRVATNVRAAVQAANGKPVLFFPARFDVPETQSYDGYAAHIGGAAGVSTAAQADAFGGTAIGTLPHALIAAFQGGTVDACLALAASRPEEPIWALVDFENDSARTAVEVFRASQQRGFRLAGVRLDTSQDAVDVAVAAAGHSTRGVNPLLVRLVRQRLDEAGAHEVRIAVSGGFNPDRIREFEAADAPVDVYAVGEQFFRGAVPFTSDVVAYYEGEKLVPCAKVGRSYRENPRLKRLK